MPFTRRPIQSDPTPIPRDLEERAEFVTRYMADPHVVRLTGAATSTPFKRRQKAEIAWANAKMRSRVSVKTSGGEWLMFD